MDIYTATADFHLPVEGKFVTAGMSVAKYAGQVLSLVDGTEYSDSALYKWIGSPNSLLYLMFVGTIPDPMPTGSVVSGNVAIGNGDDFVTLAGAAFGFVPTALVVTVWKPGAPDSNIFATVRESTITADGFTADLSAPVGAGYYLSYVVAA